MNLFALFPRALIQCGLLLCLSASVTQAVAQAAMTVDQIMTKVDFTMRKSFKTQIASVKITTCKYTQNKGVVSCAEKPRIVVADNAKKVQMADGLYSTRQLSIVREPVSDKGTGLLVYEYGDEGHDNDNWLYLPALGKVNRIIANDDEGGSVFGSEFSVESTENPEARKLNEFTYKIQEDTVYQDRPVWVIDIVPTAEKARKTKYSKVVAWIDKEHFIALKEDLYRGGVVHKQRTQSDVRSIDGVYVAMKVIMNNRTASRVSQMDKMAMRHNVELDDDYLTQRALTDFAFRERNLAGFRDLLSKQ